MHILVYIYYPPPKKNKTQTNLKIALRDQEQCITPQQNTRQGTVFGAETVEWRQSKGSSFLSVQCSTDF